MNREEFERHDIQIVKRGEPLASRTALRDEYIISLEQRNAELEQHIKELEAPKTCEGCEYRQVVPHEGCTHWSSAQEDCCIRYNNPSDFYKPKQNHVH